MHEISLIQDLLRQVEQLRQDHHADRVVAITVQVGELAGVDLELFRGAYEMLVAAGSIGTAKLELIAVPLEGLCQGCGHAFRIERFRFVCPMCGGQEVTPLRGESLILQQVTFEMPARFLPPGFLNRALDPGPIHPEPSSEEIPHGPAG